jgi:sn-glycerol 3-phosphate transport system ATP-binding protein
MNLLRLERRPHRRQRRARGPARRTGWACGPKPSRWAAGVPATVRSIEYLGADLILHCAVGSETLTVRTGGQADLAAGSEVLLDWRRERLHHFDAQGQRLH